MPSERVQRQIDRLLDEAEQAVAKSDWALVRDRAQNVLRLDPQNADALAYLAAAEREPGQVVKSMEHLDFAITEFRAMKMQPSLERVLKHEGLLKA